MADAVGVPSYDRERVSKILSTMQDIPFSEVDSRWIESEVLQNPAVLSAQLSQNPFGRATLEVNYRRPVAVLAGRSQIALDERGTLYPEPNLPEGLIPLDLPYGGPPTLLTVAGTWDSARIAKLALSARLLNAKDVWRIQVDDRGVVCLNRGIGRVVLGSMEDLDKKLSVLKERVAELDSIETLNLTHPDKPSVVPRKP